VLDDITLGPLLEQPAREDAMPLIVAALLDIDLHESACFRHFFPWRRRLAGAQPHDRIVDAEGLARLHLECLGDAVAFVEDADLGDALCHRRARQALVSADGIASHFLGIARLGAIAGRLTRAASGQRYQRQGQQGGHDEAAARRDAPERGHASGVQAS
jgi:hypothetical protein